MLCPVRSVDALQPCVYITQRPSHLARCVLVFLNGKMR